MKTSLIGNQSGQAATKICIINGVITGESKVEVEVIVTDNATSPPAKNTIRLDATPPGHEPISITPAATSGSKSNIYVVD